MRIAFVVRTVWGLGGTIKATLNTAQALAEAGHEVAIVSCVRNRERPAFKPDPRIRIENLIDARAPAQGGERQWAVDRWRAGRPSAHGDDFGMEGPIGSALLDHRLGRWLRRSQAEAVVGTHPALNRRLAVLGRPGVRTIAWEHAYFERHDDRTRDRIRADYAGLDAVVTGTEADALAYREALDGFDGTVAAVPNLVPAVDTGGRGEEPLVMAAGRLAKEKGFDVLIRAFSKTADRHPRWRLRIYGRGAQKAELRQLIEDTRSEGRIELAGASVPLDPQWGRAAIAAVPSRHEGFGLTLVEAMSARLPVVAAAAPHGPRELIDHGRNGLLVEPGDVWSLAGALDRLMDDPALRRSLAEEGLGTARAFEPARVVGRWEAVLAGEA